MGDTSVNAADGAVPKTNQHNLQNVSLGLDATTRLFVLTDDPIECAAMTDFLP